MCHENLGLGIEHLTVSVLTSEHAVKGGGGGGGWSALLRPDWKNGDDLIISNIWMVGLILGNLPVLILGNLPVLVVLFQQETLEYTQTYLLHCDQKLPSHCLQNNTCVDRDGPWSV